MSGIVCGGGELTPIFQRQVEVYVGMLEKPCDCKRKWLRRAERPREREREREMLSRESETERKHVRLDGLFIS